MPDSARKTNLGPPHGSGGKRPITNETLSILNAKNAGKNLQHTGIGPRRTVERQRPRCSAQETE